MIFLFLQTLESIAAGKKVTYTGERVKMPNYQTLTEKDILQIAVNTNNTVWSLVDTESEKV